MSGVVTTVSLSTMLIRVQALAIEAFVGEPVSFNTNESINCTAVSSVIGMLTDRSVTPGAKSSVPDWAV